MGEKKHPRKSDKEIKEAWDHYQEAQASNPRRQKEVMDKLEEQMEEDS